MVHEGHLTRRALGKIIGNAVPISLLERLFHQLLPAVGLPLSR